MAGAYKRKGTTLAPFLDENGIEAKREKINSFPTNFLLNEDGEVIMKNISLKELRALLGQNLD